MEQRIGTKPGMIRSATILKYNGDGTVRVALDEGSIYGPANEFNAPIPAAWMGPSGEFMGGCPELGMSVMVSQGHGGQWFVIGYINSNDVFDGSFVSASDTLMSSLKPGVALIQVKNEVGISVDPNEGSSIGNPQTFQQINPNCGIITHNMKGEFSFTESSRNIDHVIRRDLVENLNRDILNSALDSLKYELSLYSVGLDPLLNVSRKTSGEFVRNPPLTEKREMVYEFARSYNYSTDEEESSRYTDKPRKFIRPRVDKQNMRADVLNLSLAHPNHLIETIKGTVVDSTGNILDINRVPLPAGRVESLSLLNSKDKSSAHDKLRAIERRSICYHFEINARKGDSDPAAKPPPNINDTGNYARDRSRFCVDIDKEGQFKINVPASSETGNISLLTRHENYSSVLAADTGEVVPNEFVRNEDKKDILIEGFSTQGSISLAPGENVKDEYVQALDRFNEQEILLGTAFHDIRATALEFQEGAPFVEAGVNLVFFDESHILNQTVEQFPDIITDTINVSGPEANAGGRSGTITLDGHLSLSVGANTVDRQSLWLDFAGGVVARHGRDRQGISYAASMDGDVVIQIGGIGIGNTSDTRFSDQNDAYIDGVFDLRILSGGQTHIIRIDDQGVHVISASKMTFSSGGNMIFKSKGNISMEAELITMYAESSPRTIVRIPETIR